MRYLLLTLLSLYSIVAVAQIDTPDFSTKGMKSQQIGDSITYLYSTDSMYKQVWERNKSKKPNYHLYYNNNIIIEGELYFPSCAAPIRSGHWIAYYNNGNIKAEGYYHNNNTIGTWKYYFENGQIKEQCHFSKIVGTFHWDYDICKTGLYEYYYPNGQIKKTGYYIAKLDTNCIDTIIVEDPVTGETQKLIQKGKHYRSYKVGDWHYYTENGELEQE